jgi:hypothetical protein
MEEQKKKKVGRRENKKKWQARPSSSVDGGPCYVLPSNTPVAMILVLCRRQGPLVDLSPPQFWSSGLLFAFPRVSLSWR